MYCISLLRLNQYDVIRDWRYYVTHSSTAGAAKHI